MGKLRKTNFLVFVIFLGITLIHCGTPLTRIRRPSGFGILIDQKPKIDPQSVKIFEKQHPHTLKESYEVGFLLIPFELKKRDAGKLKLMNLLQNEAASLGGNTVTGVKIFTSQGNPYGYIQANVHLAEFKTQLVRRIQSVEKIDDSNKLINSIKNLRFIP